MSKKTHGRPKVMFDLDGVLFDFTTEFFRVMNIYHPEVVVRDSNEVRRWSFKYAKMNPSDPKSPTVPRKWVDETWESIKNGTIQDFWGALSPLIDFDTANKLRGLEFSADVYFATSRNAGCMIKEKTVNSLVFSRMAFHPSVLLVEKKLFKSALVGALGITHFVDDHGPTCLAVKMDNPDTIVKCVAYPYNEEYKLAMEDYKIERIESVKPFISLVEKEAQAYLKRLEVGGE